MVELNTEMIQLDMKQQATVEFAHKLPTMYSPSLNIPCRGNSNSTSLYLLSETTSSH